MLNMLKHKNTVPPHLSLEGQMNLSPSVYLYSLCYSFVETISNFNICTLVTFILYSYFKFHLCVKIQLIVFCICLLIVIVLIKNRRRNSSSNTIS